MKSDSHACWIHETRPGRTLPRASGPNPWSSPQPQVAGSICCLGSPKRTRTRRFPFRKSHVSSHIPIRHHRTNPTPPDESDTTGQVFFRIRMNPTSPDQSDRLQPPHNPSVVGSIPTGPTSPTNKAVTTTVAATIRGSFEGRTHRSTHTGILPTTYFGGARKLECFVRYRFEPLQPINEVAQRRPIDVESLA